MLSTESYGSLNPRLAADNSWITVAPVSHNTGVNISPKLSDQSPGCNIPDRNPPSSPLHNATCIFVHQGEFSSGGAWPRRSLLTAIRAEPVRYVPAPWTRSLIISLFFHAILTLFVVLTVAAYAIRLYKVQGFILPPAHCGINKSIEAPCVFMCAILSIFW